MTSALFDSLCVVLDKLYEGRPIQRFFVLETVARAPYFSYVSVIHLFESFGWWRASELRKVHFAEEWNELHHLLIMESLGGNAEWKDRFFAYHAVLAYYWALVALYIFRPQLSYNFSHLVEVHAHVTYEQFLEENAEVLKKLPPPPIAVNYYQTGDLYLFDTFMTSKERKFELRRPPCDNLYDVFRNISDDEAEHIKTMAAMEDWCKGGESPIDTLDEFYQSKGGLSIVGEDYEEKRKQWLEFSEQTNAKKEEVKAKEEVEAAE